MFSIFSTFCNMNCGKKLCYLFLFLTSFIIVSASSYMRHFSYDNQNEFRKRVKQNFATEYNQSIYEFDLAISRPEGNNSEEPKCNLDENENCLHQRSSEYEVKRCDSKMNKDVLYFMTAYNLKKSTSCTITVEKAPGAVQLKFDFLEYSVGQENKQTGDCGNNYLLIIEDGSDPIKLCGDIKNQHVYYNIKKEVKIIIELEDASRPQWDIKVTQLGPSRKSPDNCLQYYEDAKGVIKTFNYGGKPTLANYNICIKKSCCIKYSACEENKDALCEKGNYLGLIEDFEIDNPQMLENIIEQEETHSNIEETVQIYKTTSDTTYVKNKDAYINSKWCAEQSIFLRCSLTFCGGSNIKQTKELCVKNPLKMSYVSDKLVVEPSREEIINERWCFAQSTNISCLLYFCAGGGSPKDVEECMINPITRFLSPKGDDDIIESENETINRRWCLRKSKAVQCSLEFCKKFIPDKLKYLCDETSTSVDLRFKSTKKRSINQENTCQNYVVIPCSGDSFKACAGFHCLNSLCSVVETERCFDADHVKNHRLGFRLNPSAKINDAGICIQYEQMSCSV